MRFTSPSIQHLHCKCLHLTWLSRLLYIQWIDIGTSRSWFISSLGRHIKQRADKSCPVKGLSFRRTWISSLDLDSDVTDRLWWEGKTLALHTSHAEAVHHNLQDLQTWWIRNEALPKSPHWLFWASCKAGSCQGRHREENCTAAGTPIAISLWEHLMETDILSLTPKASWGYCHRGCGPLIFLYRSLL